MIGVVLEQFCSQSSKAESLPSVLVSTSAVEDAAAAVEANAKGRGSAGGGGGGVSANFKMSSHKSNAYCIKDALLLPGMLSPQPASVCKNVSLAQVR